MPGSKKAVEASRLFHEKGIVSRIKEKAQFGNCPD